MRCPACGVEVLPERRRCWGCDRTLPSQPPHGQARPAPHTYSFLTADPSALRSAHAWWGVVIIIVLLVGVGLTPLLVDRLALRPGDLVSAAVTKGLTQAVQQTLPTSLSLPTPQETRAFGQPVEIAGTGRVLVRAPTRPTRLDGRTVPAGQELLVAAVVLTARGAPAITWSRSAWSADDGQGNRYPVAAISGDGWLADGVIQPSADGVVETLLPFLIPEGTTLVSVAFQPVGQAVRYVWRTSP